jgi:hypothetical protein
VRAILESYSKEILDSASDQFLDLVVGVRLQIISARELVKLLPKAKRLGYQKTGIIEDEDGVHPIQEANEPTRLKPNGIENPKPRASIAGKRRSLSMASTQPPPQIVRTQPKSGETSLSRYTHTSMLPIPKGLLLPRKQMATAFGAYRCCGYAGLGINSCQDCWETGRKGVLKDQIRSAGRSSCCEV